MKILKYNKFYDKDDIFHFYNNFGFVVIKKFFNKKLIENVKKQILNKIKYKIKNNFFYYEKINNKFKLRRIEKVSDFSINAKKIINSKKISEMLYKLKKKNLVLFKDKLNFKYAGGVGYLPHIDGHFIWKDKLNVSQQGWKKYSNNFINLLIPLDNANRKNGCLYLAKKEDTKKIGPNFNKIVKKMNADTYTIKNNYIKKLKFFPIELNSGDVCFFDWHCAHFSKKNNSKKSRMMFYATYCSKNKLKNIRKTYYSDKHDSKNSNKKKSLLYN